MKMCVQPIDLEAMFNEIKTIREKYNIPKGMAFLPDKIEIILEREGTNNFNLTYSESFNYLPEHVLNVARESTIQFIQLMGLHLKKIIQTEKGVKLQVSGDFSVASSPIIEILLQSETNEQMIKDVFERICKIYQMFNQLFKFYRHWDADTEIEFNNWIMALNRIKQEYPSFFSEVEEVVKKYTVKKE
jgi:hypothetical protein